MENQNKLYRLHLETGKDTCKQLPFMVVVKPDGSRAVVKSEITNSQELPQGAVQQLGCFVINQDYFNQIQQKMALDSNANANLPLGVGFGETAGGNAVSYRTEMAGAGRKKQVFKITINNTGETSPAIRSFVLFDKVGLNQASLGIANETQLAALLTSGGSIGGNYGTSTFTRFQDIASFAALDFHQLHVQQVSGGTFFTAGEISYVTAENNLNGSPIREEIIDFTLDYDGTQYDPNVRLSREDRYQANAFTGFKVIVPVGTSVTISFYLNAAGLGHQMVKTM